MKVNKQYLVGALLGGIFVSNTNTDIYADFVYENMQNQEIIPAGNTNLVGINKDSVKAQSSMKYMSYFTLYGEMYGVDPYLLMAMACTESNGNPNCKYANNYGLMQINFTGTKKSIKAYNHVTKKEETINITSSSQLLGESSVAFNIKAGAMQMQEKARELYYNPLATIQGYNMGQNGLKRSIAYYVSNGNIQKGKNLSLKDTTLLNYIQNYDTDWITKQFNGKTALELYRENGGAGTPSYLINTLGYYRGDDKQPWIMDEKGNKYVVNGVSSSVDLESQVKKQMKVKADDLNVRVGPGTSYSIRGVVYNNETVKVLEELSNNWVKIIFNDSIGYVSNVKNAYLEDIEDTELDDIPELDIEDVITPDLDDVIVPDENIGENTDENPEEDVDNDEEGNRVETDTEDDTEASTAEYMQVKVNDLKVRAGASVSYREIGSLNKGDKIEVIETLSNGWVKTYYNNSIGYVSNVKGAYLESTSPITYSKMTVKVNDLNVRTGASTSYTTVGKLNKGDVVTVIEKLSNEWVKIEYNNGFAYVSNVKGAYLQ